MSMRSWETARTLKLSFITSSCNLIRSYQRCMSQPSKGTSYWSLTMPGFMALIWYTKLSFRKAIWLSQHLHTRHRWIQLSATSDSSRLSSPKCSIRTTIWERIACERFGTSRKSSWPSSWTIQSIKSLGYQTHTSSMKLTNEVMTTKEWGPADGTEILQEIDHELISGRKLLYLLTMIRLWSILSSWKKSWLIKRSNENDEKRRRRKIELTWLRILGGGLARKRSSKAKKNTPSLVLSFDWCQH